MNGNDLGAKLREEMSGVRVSPRLRARVMDAARVKEEPVMMKKMSVALICAILTVVMSAVALAAAARMGMLDFAGQYMNSQMPGDDVSTYIENDVITLENEYVSATIRELYYDGTRLRTVTDVRAKGNAMLVGNAVPEDPMFNMTKNYVWGGDIGPSVRDYYDEHGFEQYISVSAGGSSEEIGGGTLDYFYNEEDGVLTVYVEDEFTSAMAERDIEFELFLQVNEACAEGGEIVRMREPLHIAAVADVASYQNVAPVEFPEAGVRIDRLSITKTPMELTYTIEYTVTDAQKFEPARYGLFFEFIDPSSDESLPVYERRLKDGMSGGESSGPANPQDDIATATQFVQSGTLGVGELHESYLLSAYDAFEKTRFGMQEIAVEPVK